MTNEDMQTAILVVLGIGIVIMTLRALYGLLAWKGRRKTALLQAVLYPTGGSILMMVVAVAFPETSPERIAAIEAERAAQAEAEAAAEVKAEAERAAQAEAEAAELEACRQDLQCWGQKYSIDAAVRCRGPIERLAQFDMRWTDGWTDTKFPRIRWENQDEGLIIYIGDKAQFQNGFGAWQNVIYTCTYDPATDSAIDVTVTPGRL